MKEPIIKRFEEEGSPYYSSARYLVRLFFLPQKDFRTTFFVMSYFLFSTKIVG